MAKDDRILDIAKKTVVYGLPATDSVMIRRDIEYGTIAEEGRAMDVYYPPYSKPGTRIPAVILVSGYPDAGFETMVGCKFKEMGSSTSWGRLIAAYGLAAITYSNREPTADLHALIQHVRHNAEDLRLDENRIGLWASSGNVPLALSVLMEEGRQYLKSAALCYGYTLDLQGSTAVAEAAKAYRFANPGAGKSIDDLRKNIPLYLARAGQDQLPHLNETLDRFVQEALSCNLPITLINHPDGPHAFDLFHDSETSREIIRQILNFLRYHLLTKES